MVKIIPDLVQNTLKNNEVKKYQNSIQNTLDDELSHIEPWINFSSSLKIDKDELLNYAAEGLTKQSIDDLLKLSQSSFEESVDALYAFEKELLNKQNQIRGFK